MTITGHATAVVLAAPAVVFEAITDIDGLPSWNAAMTSVVEGPDKLEPGSEWVVEFRALGSTWNSRSVVEEIDHQTCRFAYRSATDDGNPSRATWRWAVDADPAGSRVTLSWELRPLTFWRRVLLARIRAFQLARSEVPASLRALAAHVAAPSSAGIG